VAAVVLIPGDLAPFADIADVKAQAMIDDAMAMAARVAPCINDADFAYPDAAKAILRGAILRWNDAGSGALLQQTVGGYSETHDTRQGRRSMFWPAEIQDLAALCADTSRSGRAFELDTAPAGSGAPAVTDEYPWYPVSGWSAR
jgi:hypothetical protein